MTTLSRVPGSYDVEYILQKMKDSGITNHYGYAHEGEEIVFRYQAEDYDAMMAVLDAYQTDYADEVLRDKLKAIVTSLRWDNQQFVPDFNGAKLEANDVTIGRIIAALDLMDRNPDLPRTRNWKVTDDYWAELDYDTIANMGRAIGIHIQACFDNEKALHTALDNAATVDELKLIDLTSGWPV